MSDNLIVTKSFAFSLRSIEFYKVLINNHEYVLSKQFLRSATSIGANVNESISAVSRKDFINKLSIALKEARECKYWIKLIRHSYSSIDASQYLLSEIDSIIKILTSIIISTKKNN